MIRKLLITIAVCAATSIEMMAVDKFAPQTNADLRADFLAYTRNFQQQLKGELIYNDLERFITEVEVLSTKDPYAWLNQAQEFINMEMRKFAPGFGAAMAGRQESNAFIRRGLLQMRDYPMHLNNQNVAPYPEAGQAAAFNYETEIYLAEARAKFLDWLDKPAPADRTLEIFKVYNMGYCLRTRNHVILFDLRWDGTSQEAAKIASKADVIFLTHNHGDHYSDVMMNAMANAGKYMVLSADKVPAYTDLTKKHVMTETFKTPIDLDGVKVQGFLGDQNGTPCFVYAIDFDGWRFAHGGDNQTVEAEGQLANYEAMDVFTIAIFSRIQSIIGFATKAPNGGNRETLFLTSHENERNHDVPGRVAFGYAFAHNNYLGNPSFDYPPILLWECGECVTLTK